MKEFKFDESKLKDKIDIKELEEKEILPVNMPPIVYEVRDLVLAKKGYIRFEQEALQKYEYNVMNNIPTHVPTVESVQKEVSEEDVVISIKDVAKEYCEISSKQGTKKEKLIFTALDGISIDIHKGEVLGIVGTNGAGKTTLTQLIVGNSDLTRGNITVNGDISLVPSRVALKEQLTGELNIDYKAALMGMKKHEIAEVKQFVEDYSELGRKLYTPVKKYSSGMKSRLGFSITLAMQTKISIIDEALSVGDKKFKEKCFNTMKERSEDADNTVIFISHSNDEVKRFCNRVLWLEHGKMIEEGSVEDVLQHYTLYTRYLSELPNKENEKYIQEQEEKRYRKVETFSEKLRRFLSHE